MSAVYSHQTASVRMKAPIQLNTASSSHLLNKGSDCEETRKSSNSKNAIYDKGGTFLTQLSSKKLIDSRKINEP